MHKYYTSADGKTLYQVPKEHRGKLIISDGIEVIAKRALANCKYITEVELPYSLLEIGMEAFRGCSSLTRIEIPCGVQKIPDKCFLGCENLTEVVLHEGVEYVGYESFGWCSSLSNIHLPDTLREIGEEAFLVCKSLTTVQLGPRLERIRSYAFQNSGINTLRLGASNKTIQFDYMVFWDTPIQHIEVDPHNTVYVDARCDVIMEKRTGNVICGSLNSTIPNTARVISHDAFGVTPQEFIVPSSVKRIENSAFNCKGCKIIRLSEGVEAIEICAFQSGYPSEPTTVYIPSSVHEIQEQLSTIIFQLSKDNKYYYYDEDGQNIISRDGKLVWGRLLNGIPTDGVKELHVTINDELGYSDLIIPANVKYVSSGIFGADCTFFEKIIVNKGTIIAFPDDWESDCEILVIELSKSLLTGENNPVKYKIYPQGTTTEELKKALSLVYS